MSLIKNFLYAGATDGSFLAVDVNKRLMVPADVGKRVVVCTYRRGENWRSTVAKEKNAGWVSVTQGLESGVGEKECGKVELEEFLKEKMKQLELVLKFQRNFF